MIKILGLLYFLLSAYKIDSKLKLGLIAIGLNIDFKNPQSINQCNATSRHFNAI